MITKKRLLTVGGRLSVACVIIFTILVYSSTTTAQEPNLPLTKPDAEIGLALFAERCAGCHGPTGQGDGEMAVNLSVPPASFADADYRKTSVPGAMFGTVVNGKFDAGMPPFGMGTENSNPIDDANIWNLIAAVYSLSTPDDAVGQGQTLYEENCAACHGESGAGDGPDAAGLEAASLDLTNLRYWFNRSNETVFTELVSEDILEHDYSLSEDELWAVVDYGRTFSYAYIDPLALVAPIASASVSGVAHNGTTNDVLSGATARLRAFTINFEETMNLTTTTSIDGRYSFDLEGVPPDWVYLASITYEGLSFSSDAGQLSRALPELDLPITVFEKTTNPAAITIDQIHVILDFFEGGVAVNEVYVVSNHETAVFVGETGEVDGGTVKFSLPDDAENISFERTMGSFDSTIPASEIIQTEAGWADTLPVTPGQGGLNLIIRYQLPYEDEATISHQLAYDTANITAIVPDMGIELDEAGWTFQGSQQMPGGTSFLTYERVGASAGSVLDLNLSGRPSSTANPSASVQVPRDQTNELLIGAGVFLVVVAGVFYMVRTWQGGQDIEDEHDDIVVEADDRVNALLQAIVDLDDAFENDEIDEKRYNVQRTQLKSELRSIWRE